MAALDDIIFKVTKQRPGDKIPPRKVAESDTHSKIEREMPKKETVGKRKAESVGVSPDNKRPRRGSSHENELQSNLPSPDSKGNTMNVISLDGNVQISKRGRSGGKSTESMENKTEVKTPSKVQPPSSKEGSVNLIDSVESSVVTPVVSESKVKRGRGRPPKKQSSNVHQQVTAHSATNVNDKNLELETTPKGRGRKRKTNLTVGAPSPNPPKSHVSDGVPTTGKDQEQKIEIVKDKTNSQELNAEKSDADKSFSPQDATTNANNKTPRRGRGRPRKHQTPDYSLSKETVKIKSPVQVKDKTKVSSRSVGKQKSKGNTEEGKEESQASDERKNAEKPREDKQGVFREDTPQTKVFLVNPPKIETSPQQRKSGGLEQLKVFQ